MRRMDQKSLKKRNERVKQRLLKAYEIAQEIAEFSESYWEAMHVIEYVKKNFEQSKMKGKAELLPYPVDNWGEKMKMPEAEAPSTN